MCASLMQAIHALVDPDLKPLHNNPGYQALMRSTIERLGASVDTLPQEARNTFENFGGVSG